LAVKFIQEGTRGIVGITHHVISKMTFRKGYLSRDIRLAKEGIPTKEGMSGREGI
jgi:hypothetical protein